MPLNLTPLPHQKRVADKLRESPGLIAYHGLGTGKTMTAVNAAHEHGLPLLAIVPAALRNNMRKEIERSGFGNEYQVLSYEEAKNRMQDPAFQDFASRALVAYDEGHRTGREESSRSKLPTEVPAAKKLFLTGTPIRNTPSEVSPMINAIAPGSLPDAKAFKQHFLPTKTVPVGFWGKLRGVRPGKEDVPANIEDFQEAVKGKVDFHENVDRSDFPSFSEEIVEVPMAPKQHAAYKFVMGRYPRLAYKIRHGIPLNKQETTNFRAFMTGPRQVSNHPGAYSASATDEDAPKILSMADTISEMHKKDPEYRGVSYSAYLDSGVSPLSRALTERGVPHAVFTGEQDDKQRKQIIEDYNSGKVPHLIISGAGAEGLDLKGTQLMQIMEPHWNEEMINQVRGRAIRYKSHSHLPEEKRHVRVQRFHAVPPPGIIGKAFGKTRGSEQSADEYIHGLAKKKQTTNAPFLEALKTAAAHNWAAQLIRELDPEGDWFMVVA